MSVTGLEAKSVCKAASMPFIVHNTRWLVNAKRELLLLGTSPVCLPSVYLMSLHVTKSPRPSPSIFTYWKRSNTGGGNSLGTRLYISCIYTKMPILKQPTAVLYHMLSPGVCSVLNQYHFTCWLDSTHWLSVHLEPLSLQSMHIAVDCSFGMNVLFIIHKNKKHWKCKRCRDSRSAKSIETR